MKHILLVDDDETNLNLLIRYSKAFDAEIDVAFSGAEAAEKIHSKKVPYDLVISDIRMPFGTGIDLIHEVRRDLGHKTPIVLMSSMGKVALEQSQALEAEAFLQKPISREEFQNLFESLT